MKKRVFEVKSGDFDTLGYAAGTYDLVEIHETFKDTEFEDVLQELGIPLLFEEESNLKDYVRLKMLDLIKNDDEFRTEIVNMVMQNPHIVKKY